MVPALLVLTDFRQPANHALAYAAQLAEAIGARLVLLHVHRDALLDPDHFTGLTADLSAEATQLAFARLTRELPVPALAEIAHGRVTDAVIAALQKHHPALLVVGRTATAGTPDELVTATALDLLRAAPYPMLVVPNARHPRLAPGRVLLAVDGESFSLGPHAGPARLLLNALHPTLTVLHVTDQPATADKKSEALASVQRTGLLIDLPAPPLARTMRAADPATGILQTAQPAAYDLVAVIARPRSFLGAFFHQSVTAHVLLHSALPVLVLPATA